MSDYNATFATHNRCTLLNTGGVFGLCTKRESRHDNSLRRIRKDAKRRARRTRLAGDSCNFGHHGHGPDRDCRCSRKNALISGHCGGCR